MRSSVFSVRLLISAWLALVLLWPLQAAAMGIGHQMTVACRMMPAILVSGHLSQGGGHGMAACHNLQCHHRFGPRTVHARLFPPVTVSVRRVSLSSVSATRCATYLPPGARGPPLYLRLSRLLI